MHQDLVDEPPLQALAGHVGAEDFEVLAAGSLQCRGDRFADVAHAQRQGVIIGRNIAASLGYGRARPYRHRDLGLVADLGGAAAVARPLGLALTGPAAKVVTKAYHLYALPSAGNRLRVAADWLTNLVSQPIVAQLGLVDREAAQLAREQRGSGTLG